MTGMRTAKALKLVASGCLALLAACTSTVPVEYPPPDMEEIGKILQCPIGYTPACERRSSRRYECYCADEDLIRKVLDPETQ